MDTNTGMKCWRASRNRAYNEAMVIAVLGIRNDCRNIIKDYSALAAKPIAEVAMITYAGCAEVRLLKACKPVFDALSELERLYGEIR